MTCWSNGMILAPRAKDPGFKSWASPWIGSRFDGLRRSFNLLMFLVFNNLFSDMCLICDILPLENSNVGKFNFNFVYCSERKIKYGNAGVLNIPSGEVTSICV